MVEAVYTVTEQQFVEAAKAYCKPRAKKLPGYVLLQLFSGIFVGLSVFITLTNPSWLTAGVLGSLAALLIVQQWRKRAIPTYQASAYAEYNEEVAVRFDEQGFHSSKTGLSTTWVAWPAFTGWMETNSMFILGMKLSWIPIPKSAFSPQQQDEIRNLFFISVQSRP